MWAAILAGTAASASYAARRQAEAAEQQRQQFIQTQQAMSPWLGGLSEFPVLTPTPEVYTPGEPCGGCGSRETVIHRGARMCAYCRSDR